MGYDKANPVQYNYLALQQSIKKAITKYDVTEPMRYLCVATKPEYVFVNLLRSPGIDFSESIPELLKRLPIRAQS